MGQVINPSPIGYCFSIESFSFLEYSQKEPDMLNSFSLHWRLVEGMNILEGLFSKQSEYLPCVIYGSRRECNR